MTDSNVFAKFSMKKEWAAAGLSNAVASGVLNPLDIVKTRIQATMPSSSMASVTPSLKLGLMRTTMICLYREGGLAGVWIPGLLPTTIREIVGSGTRVCLYIPIRDSLMRMSSDQPQQSSLKIKVLSAMITGSCGTILSNPIDVIKIRVMVNPACYTSLSDAGVSILRSEGIGGFYRGVFPSVLRGANIAAGELATYDHAKELLRCSLGREEGYVLHILSSLITGLVATTVAAPFDLLKTRAMNSSDSTGFLRHVLDIIRREGLFTFFKGWLPAYFRLGPHALICFPLYEQCRRAMGLQYF